MHEALSSCIHNMILDKLPLIRKLKKELIHPDPILRERAKTWLEYFYDKDKE